MFGFALTYWVQRLLVFNTLVFLFTYAVPDVTYWFAFTPARVLVQPWTIITYMFLHGNLMHLFFNMLGLFFFGPPLEARWGSNEFLKFYFICGLGGALLSFLFAFNSPIIGASAAVYGVMLAFAMNWPDTPIYIWGIFPVPAKILVGVLAVFSLMSAFQGASDGVAHFAHIGGFVAAWGYLKWDRRRRGSGMDRFRKMMSKRKLTVVPGGKDSGDSGGVTRNDAGNARNDNVLLDELDRVLDKISSHGMSSLTPAERKLLDDVSRRFRQN